MSLTADSHISLIDLGAQFPFQIDINLKKKLCFSETLVISCAHYEGVRPGDDDSESMDGGRASSSSDWVCSSTTSEVQEEYVEKTPFETKDFVPEPPAPEEKKDDDDDDEFYFYFFPDCKIPPVPQHSKQSIVIDDNGMPMMNLALKNVIYCTCKKNKKGICKCNVDLPCKCGAKEQKECTCKKLDNVCYCHNLPLLECTCIENRVCTCFSGPPCPVCKCKEVVKPCICKIYPSPVCECKFKPSFVPRPGNTPPAESIEDVQLEEGYGEYFGEGEEGYVGRAKATSGEEAEKIKSSGRTSITSKASKFSKTSRPYETKNEKEEEPGPCTCQQLDRCLCRKAEKCICREDMCVCGVQKSCVCQSTDSIKQPCVVQSAESRTVCECPIPKECTCEAKGLECKCFEKKPFCVCGDPENCKCNQVCDCIPPCICDTLPGKSKECICLDKRKLTRTCPCKDKNKKILKEEGTCTCPCKDKKKEIPTEVETCICPCKDIKEKEPTCTCPCKEKSVKIKKVRKGKHGWRWCNDVDPYHTFFDYGYDRHHLVDDKEQEKEVFKNFGVNDEKDEDICSCDVCGPSRPRFKKRVRKPSLDCRSSVGGITISVEPLGEEENKFLVNVVSHASKGGAKTASKLVSIVDLNLHTLEESRTESISKKDLTKERRNYMAVCDVGYYNKVTRICGERNVVKKLYHQFENAKEFLLEGANIMLLRYIALRRYNGSAKTKTVLMDGTICESVYLARGVSQAIVNGKQFFVIKVTRHIVEASGYSQQTLTVLSLKGYIISHEWVSNDYMLHLNPLLNVIPEKDEIEQRPRLRHKWREDMQILSDFLDYKARRTAEGARYISENGKLTSTVRDYLQSILLLRPSEVMQFTRLYFESALSSIELPREEYSDPATTHLRYFYIED